MNIRLNDELRAIDHGATLDGLLDELGLAARKGIAVAINDAVITRSSWASHKLTEGDRVLVIQATQGG
jgi:sulfur carrier protein